MMRKTKRFKNILEKVAKVSPRFWKIIGTIGLFVSLYFMLQGTYLLVNIAYNIYIGQIKQPALQFILPAPTATGSSGPGYILIPFWLWIITVAAILVPHEFMHGVIARAEKIKLKSVGLLLLAVFPGAFVEPDEKQLKKTKLTTKLRVFAAGSFTNIAISFFLIYFTLYALWPAVTKPGIILNDVNQSSPAYEAGLRPGMIITDINDTKVTTTYREYLEGRGYLTNELGNAKPGDTVIVKANGSLYNVKLSLNNQTNSTYMGILYSPIFLGSTEFFLSFLMPLITMISLFSLAVGIVNILPIYPLDGGRILDAIAQRFFKRNSKQLVRAVSYAILLLFIYSFIGPFFRI